MDMPETREESAAHPGGGRSGGHHKRGFFSAMLTRKRTLAARKHGDAYYRSLFANMMDGFAHCQMLYDAAGEASDFLYLEVNEAFEAQTGLRNVVGKRVSEVIPGIQESDQNLLDIYGRIARTGVPERFEIHVAALNSWFSISAYSPEKDHFVALFESVTERKRAEETLREKEYYLEKSQAVTHVGHWHLNLLTQELTTSDELLRILQLRASEVNLDILKKMVHPDDRDWAMAYVDRAMSEGQGYEVEHRLLFRDGLVKWVRAIGEAKVGQGGLVEHLYVTTQDITAQKHAAEVLNDSEERYRNLVELSPEAIYVHVGGAFVFSNSAGLKLVGASSPHELIGTAVMDRIHPNFHALVNRRLAGIAENRDCPDMVEERLIRLDGSEVDAEVVARPFSYHGWPAVQVIARDITERKRAEEQLRWSHEKLTRLQQSTGSGIWDWNIVTGQIEWSPEMYALLGLTTTSGAPSFEIWRGALHPADRADAETRIERALQDNTPLRNEYRVLWGNGQIRWILAVGHATYDDHGAPIRMTGICLDITEQKKADQALKDREQEFRGLLDAIPDNITLQDRDFRIVWANRRCSAGEAEGADGLIGKRCFAAWHGRSEPCEVCPVMESMATGKPGRHVVKSKDARLWDLQSVPLFDEEGNIKNVIEVARDITEVRMLEEQLLQSQKMESVGRLAGGVAHDFNNMLSVILGHTELAMTRVAPSEPIHKDLVEIEHAAHRSADLTRQLLAFARKQTVVPKVLSINTCVEGLISMLRRLIGEDIELLWSPGREIWNIIMDSSQLDQILTNLCVNARDAISGPGRISISTENADYDDAWCATHAGYSPGQFVHLSVQDNGEGMDQETLGHLFEPFFTTKDLGRGTGLGLATVYGVIQQNKGFIHVHSEIAHGTSFEIHLPRYLDKAEERSLYPEVTGVLPGRETVLVVEDEPALLKLSETVLKQMGYHVLAATTPGEAIQMARRQRGEIQLVMTDVIMPEMNGRVLAKQVQTLYPQIKKLFMSGYTTEIVSREGILEGGAHFIQKPFSMAQLSTKIREVLQ